MLTDINGQGPFGVAAVQSQNYVYVCFDCKLVSNNANAGVLSATVFMPTEESALMVLSGII